MRPMLQCMIIRFATLTRVYALSFPDSLLTVPQADMIEVLKTRPDFCYLCDVAPKDIEPYKALCKHPVRFRKN